MLARIATESQWKAFAQKHHIKDIGLQKALAAFEKAGDDKQADKVRALDAVKKLAASMSKDKTVGVDAEAVKFLKTLEASVDGAKKEVAAAAKASEKEAPEKQADLSKLKGQVSISKKLAQEVKQMQDRLRADLQAKGGSVCTAEWERARKALVEIVKSILRVEAVAPRGTGRVLAEVAREAIAHGDDWLEWGHAADELILCLKRSNATAEAATVQALRARAQTAAAALRREGDAVRKMK